MNEPVGYRAWRTVITLRTIDHIALPSHDCAALIDFYGSLGFAVVGELDWRTGVQPFVSLALDNVKINLHDPRLWQDERFTLRGASATPGCGDVCFVWSGSVDDAITLVLAAGGELLTGPVQRVGGTCQAR